MGTRLAYNPRAGDDDGRFSDYRVFADALPVIAHLNDPDGQLVYVNRACTEFAGAGIEEIGGLRWLGAVHPDDLEGAVAAWERAQADGESYEAEFRVRRSDGVYRLLDTRSEPLCTEDGSIWAWLGISIDRTERTQFEQELRASEAVLDTLQTEAPVGFGFISSELRFVRVNHELAAVDGLPAEDHIGKAVAEVVPELWPTLEPLYDRVLAGEKIIDAEVHGRTAADPETDRDWLASYYPVRVGEKIIGAGVLVREITEQRRLEHQRRGLLKELVTAQEDERRRIADDIHDGPLQVCNAIQLRLEMLRDDAPEHREAIDRIREELGSAAGSMRGLLFELRPAALVDGGLVPALSELLAEVRRAGGPRGVLSGALSADPPLDLRTIAYRIAREAITNAAKHSGTDRIDVEVADRDAQLVIRVRDHGRGFTDADGERDARHYGLLSMRERAETAGGWWQLSSELGAGTTVEFAIPSAPHG